MTKKSDKPKKQPTGDYGVGYCRPPSKGQFQKGKSGNKKGRPHKKKKEHSRKEMNDEFMKMMDGDIIVRINGQPTKISAIDALKQQILADALKGDFRRQKLLLERYEGNIKVEEAVRDAKNALPGKITVEFVESDGNGGRKKYDRYPGDPNAKEIPLEEDDDDDAWLK